MIEPSSQEIETLLAPWSGPYGGLPPFDRATPFAIERACVRAIESKRAEIRAIADNPVPPTFENTVEALENSGRDLQRANCLFTVFRQTMNSPEMGEVEQRLVPLLSALDDEIAHDGALFARIEAVWNDRDASGLAGLRQRLTSVVRDRMKRRGAGLSAESKARLAGINRHIAELQARFNRNLLADQDGQAVFIEEVDGLEGLGEEQRSAAAREAEERGVRAPGRFPTSVLPSGHS